MESVLTYPRLGLEVSAPKRTLTALLCIPIVFMTFLLAGCNAAWINTALADLPTLVQVALNIAGLVSVVHGQQPSPQETFAIQNIGTQAKNGLQLIQTLYNDYKANPTDTTKEKIVSAIQDLNANLAQLLQTAGIKNPTLLAQVTAAVGIISDTLNSILSNIPTSSTTSRRARTVNGLHVPNKNEIKQQWRDKVGVPLQDIKA